MVGKYWSWYNCSASGRAHLSTEASTVWICACKSTDWWPAEGCSLQLQPPWRLRRTSSYARVNNSISGLAISNATCYFWYFLCHIAQQDQNRVLEFTASFLPSSLENIRIDNCPFSGSHIRRKYRNFVSTRARRVGKPDLTLESFQIFHHILLKCVWLSSIEASHQVTNI